MTAATHVEARDLGAWLPEVGLAVNARVDGHPAIVTHPDILRRVGRRRGVLAAAETWDAAFPSRRAPRAPLPMQRPFQLGQISLLCLPADLPGGVHLRILAPQAEVLALVAPDIRLPAGLGPAPLVLSGPWAEGGFWDTAHLEALAAGWPGARVVLYGPRALASELPRSLPSGALLELLRPPGQPELI